MRREDPKYVEKRKKFMAMQKAKSQDKFNKGGLSPKQKVIAAKAPPPNKIKNGWWHDEKTYGLCWWWACRRI